MTTYLREQKDLLFLKYHHEKKRLLLDYTNTQIKMIILYRTFGFECWYLLFLINIKMLITYGFIM